MRGAKAGIAGVVTTLVALGAAGGGVALAVNSAGTPRSVEHVGDVVWSLRFTATTPQLLTKQTQLQVRARGSSAWRDAGPERTRQRLVAGAPAARVARMGSFLPEADRAAACRTRRRGGSIRSVATFTLSDPSADAAGADDVTVVDDRVVGRRFCRR